MKKTIGFKVLTVGIQKSYSVEATDMSQSGGLLSLIATEPESELVATAAPEKFVVMTLGVNNVIWVKPIYEVEPEEEKD